MPGGIVYRSVVGPPSRKNTARLREERPGVGRAGAVVAPWLRIGSS